MLTHPCKFVEEKTDKQIEPIIQVSEDEDQSKMYLSAVNSQPSNQTSPMIYFCENRIWEGAMKHVESNPGEADYPIHEPKTSDKTTTFLHILLIDPCIERERRVRLVMALLAVSPKSTMVANWHGWLPIHMLINNKEAKMDEVVKHRILKELIMAYPKSLVVGDDKCKQTPLHMACEHLCPSSQELHMLLSWNKTPTMMKDARGNLPVHIAAAKRCSAESMSMLLTVYPPGVDIKNHRNQTPLDIAHETSTDNNPKKTVIKVMGTYLAKLREKRVVTPPTTHQAQNPRVAVSPWSTPGVHNKQSPFSSNQPFHNGFAAQVPHVQKNDFRFQANHHPRNDETKSQKNERGGPFFSDRSVLSNSSSHRIVTPPKNESQHKLCNLSLLAKASDTTKEGMKHVAIQHQHALLQQQRIIQRHRVIGEISRLLQVCELVPEGADCAQTREPFHLITPKEAAAQTKAATYDERTSQLLAQQVIALAQKNQSLREEHQALLNQTSKACEEQKEAAGMRFQAEIKDKDQYYNDQKRIWKAKYKKSQESVALLQTKTIEHMEMKKREKDLKLMHQEKCNISIQKEVSHQNERRVSARNAKKRSYDEYI
eukprot:scaffold159160_cov58-Attheya_sp.AAC.1